MTKKKNKKFPTIQKDLKHFLQNEEGKIVHENATKLAASVIVAGSFLSTAMKPVDSEAVPQCVHQSHASHGSHGSHSTGGWC